MPVPHVIPGLTGGLIHPWLDRESFDVPVKNICVIFHANNVTDVDMPVKPATTIVLAWTIILARSSKIATNEVPGNLFQNFRIKKCGNYIMLNI